MLGFLANLRDMKTALTSGMILLVVIWLIFGNNINDTPPSDTLGGNIRRLVDFLGAAPTLGVIIFVAYVLGLVVTSHYWINVLTVGRQKVTESVATVTEKRLVNAIDEAYEAIHTDLTIDQIINALDLKLTTTQKISVNSKHTRVRKMEALKEFVTIPTRDAVFKDVPLLAVHLASKKDKSWERFDKAIAEAEFRAGIAGPLFLLGMVVMVRTASENDGWLMLLTLLITLATVCALIVKAKNKRQEANEELINAIVIGDIDVPMYTALKKLSEAPGAVAAPPVPAASGAAQPTG